MGIEKASLGIVLGVGVSLISLNNVSAEAFQVQYAKENLNIRRQPSLNAGIITTVKKGSKLQVLSSIGTWAKIKYNGTVAYCHKDYIINEKNLTPSKGDTVISEYILNLRKGPSTEYLVIGKIQKGEELKVLTTTGEWLQISHKGKIGYCNRNYVKKIFPNLNNEKFKNIVSVYTTTFKLDGCRSKNIEKAGNAINNKIIKPGETFSFNSCAAPYNKNNGYSKAPIFVGNEKKDGYGGGVCQVSTTLFNACLKAGIIPKYRNHSSKVAYADYGLDATVTDYQNFTFKNSFKEELKIKTVMSKNGLYGTITTYIQSDNPLLNGNVYTPKVRKIKDKVYETQLLVTQNGKLKEIKNVGISTYLK